MVTSVPGRLRTVEMALMYPDFALKEKRYRYPTSLLFFFRFLHNVHQFFNKLFSIAEWQV
jgi:hypothetical protein